MSGWRPALRIAWRDALRHRGRSILVLVMISLPVLAVSAAAVLIKTSEVTGVEAADRVMGAADARVRTEGRGEVVQLADPIRGDAWMQVGDFDYDDPLDASDVQAVLGDDARLVPIAAGWQRARLGERVVSFSTTGVDLSDPLARGLFGLETGRLPGAPGEVVVNDAMLDKGFAIGDDVRVGDAMLTIVGAGRDATVRDQPVMLGSVADLPSDSTNVREWLVSGGPVNWSTVRELNAVGGLVTSRAVLADPPDFAAIAEQMGMGGGSSEMVAVAVLIVVMALIEVVLLAGPAFAVGARRHARTLALIAASGGTPRQSRRVILGSGLVLGLVASAVGLVLGVVAGWALEPLVQRFNGEWFGPFELPWRYLAAIVAFGLVSALLASVVPAWLASRQDVVAVLAGRRGDRRPRASTPVVGLVLLGVGVAASAYGAVTSDNSSGAFWIAGAAIVSVLGMILVVPVVVAAFARWSGRLPLTARYAARDAARHRTRTVPAVAAVAATVAGVVALGIANASDELQNQETYRPQAPMGAGELTWAPEVLPGEAAPDVATTWDRIESAIHRAVPEVRTTAIRGPEQLYDPNGYTSTYVEGPRGIEEDECCLDFYGFSSTVVADRAVELGLDGEEARLVDAGLSAGQVVLFTSRTDSVDEVTIRTETWRGESATEPESRSSERVPARLVAWDADRFGPAPAMAVLPTEVAGAAGIPVATSSLRLTGDLDEATETRIRETVDAVVTDSSLYVERGYQRPAEAVIILVVLGALGAVLMLGGTLTATFLALSDARPDLATLSAVGAAPRTRRRVAASYALVIGAVGAVLGAAIGFIPGIAISRPLTAGYGSTGPGPDGPFLAIPWALVLVIVVALPLLTAAVVGLTARSRLPLVARLD
ncbi:FtsX-like permease family protein [Nocardioides KLBMP 9356]|uniref:FtsX-like permease family protein n=1 Tax=Nocardioides potassii TaxID=2911371 RepID=A0ABS9HBX2_9ACTN|nr:FtsX-like permease family protein [Nocardioides potassii]MCF6378641.1 FtsX-like permease family protein [Nocardioides potassii]